MEESLLKIIQKNPIGTTLDSFPASFNVACEKERLPRTPDSLGQLGHDSLKNIAFFLILTLQALPASSLLPSHGSGTSLVAELSRLGHQIRSSSFDRGRVCPLLEAVLAKRGDVSIWSEVYKAVQPTPQEPRVTLSPANASPRTCKAVQPTPLQEPPVTLPSPAANACPRTTGKAVLAKKGDVSTWNEVFKAVQPTPLQERVTLAEPRLAVTTSSEAPMLSSEVSMSRDSFLRSELKSLYVDVPGFHEAFFGGVPDLRQAAEAIFRECQQGSDPLYRRGWKGWPRHANQHNLWTWFTDTISILADLVAKRTRARRRHLARLESLEGASLIDGKVDVGFVEDAASSDHPWSTVLIAGQLGPHAGDFASDTWIDMARCLGRMLAAQDTRRFALGFTLHGPLMRLWECDRLGGIASSQLDVNRDGLQFVKTVLAFLWMNGEQLGFDPTIQTSPDGKQRFIEIQRRGQAEKERLLIDHVMVRTSRIAGRATTCWKARRADGQPLVIKDSWQYADREEEGRLLQLAASRQVVNVARYYHHETVVVGGIDDDVHASVRRGLQVNRGTNCEPALMPRLHSGMGAEKVDVLRNRVHRRVIVADYGKPIYRASCIPVLLGALMDCIRGHGSLYAAGLLHRDVSINNLIISSRSTKGESRRGYLIDLDLAVSPGQPEVSTAGTKTGTRAFMAIGLLLGEHHCFMHDLESFFWVLFWICVHYSGPGREVDNGMFERWTDEGDAQLAEAKRGLIGDEKGFLRVVEEQFTPLYRPMAPWVNELRRVVFPDDEAWKTKDERLYADMIGVLSKAREALGPEQCS